MQGRSVRVDSGVRAALRTGWLGLRLVLWEDRVESPLSCPAHLPPALLHHPGRKSLVLAFFCCRQKSQHSEGSLFTSEVQFSRAVVSDSLRPHGLQHARHPCPSPPPGVYSNSCPSSRWTSSHLILCHPLLLPPSVFPSIRVFSNKSVLCIGWPKYWSFSFSISPSNEYSLISFRIEWLDLLAVPGTLKSLLQYHSSKASVLQHSAFLMVQLSHPYMTTGKTVAFTRWNFVSKVMSLLF